MPYQPTPPSGWAEKTCTAKSVATTRSAAPIPFQRVGIQMRENRLPAPLDSIRRKITTVSA